MVTIETTDQTVGIETTKVTDPTVEVDPNREMILGIEVDTDQTVEVEIIKVQMDKVMIEVGMIQEIEMGLEIEVMIGTEVEIEGITMATDTMATVTNTKEITIKEGHQAPTG
jgi:alanine racemase